MSVEKVPNMAAHGACLVKSTGGIKGGHGGAQGADDGSDPEGVFGALLSSLGVDDAESTMESSAVPAAPEEQPKGNVNSHESTFIAFTPIVQAALLPVTAASVDNIALSGAQNTLPALGDTPASDGIELIAANANSTGVLPGTTHGFRSPSYAELSQIPDATGSGIVGTKSVRLLKERARTEDASAITALPVQSANAVVISRLDMRAVGEKVEPLGRAISPVAADVTPWEVGQQIEFRRDKTIFKMNSTSAGADLSVANGPDAKPAHLNLEAMAPDVGSGMTQGDQNPGTYWMSSDMKNAEMKLDGFGESPVEVSISVHGNQTHIAFRTDEAQTRLALEDAGSTLKDMLNKEGLNLAGVSVGTSGAGGDGSQDPRSRQEGRSALIESLANKFPTGTAGHVVASRVGQLDVFV